MKHITFTATATFPKEDVLTFAIANGYTENKEETPEMFVSNFFKSSLVDLVGKATVRYIAIQKEQEKMEAIQEAKERLAQAINVSS